MRGGWLQSEWMLGLCIISLVLMIGACGQGDPDPLPEDQVDAGWSRLKVKAKCEPPNVWHLASHFKLARKVDYVADCDDSGAVISEKGEGCSGASDRAQCEADVATPGFGRHLVTREGNSVRLWTNAAATLLGKIDTPEEAIWLVLQQDINVDCDTRVYDSHNGGYSVDGDRVVPDCHERDFFEVHVSKDGLVSNGMELKKIVDAGANCAPGL